MKYFRERKRFIEADSYLFEEQKIKIVEAIEDGFFGLYRR